jgi:hypothetical protein
VATLVILAQNKGSFDNLILYITKRQHISNTNNSLNTNNSNKLKLASSFSLLFFSSLSRENHDGRCKKQWNDEEWKKKHPSKK